LIGGAGIDTASYVGAGAVTVSLAVGGAQNTLGAGTDTLSGIENLLGGSGGDSLTGDTGANRLDGNGGDDVLKGNGGADTFAVANAGGSDHVIDFTNGTDRLAISGFGTAFDTAGEVLARAVQAGTDTRITLANTGVAGNTVITLDGFNLANLDASDLIIIA
jgi:Ca2+-binding RTX toxin-like protein